MKSSVLVRRKPSFVPLILALFMAMLFMVGCSSTNKAPSPTSPTQLAFSNIPPHVAMFDLTQMLKQ